MGTDRAELLKRGLPPRKATTAHPIAAIQKRVMDSAAYADLTFSARAVLILLCRNIEKDRNGHIQLSEKQAADNGIERKTLRRAFRDLIAHQLIVMTWRGGKVQGSCNKYGLTWMPIKDRKGIHADHFKLDSWRDWKSECNKTGGPKRPQDSAQNVPLIATSIPKMSPTPGDKKGLIEAIPRTDANSADSSQRENRFIPQPYGAWLTKYFSSLAEHGPHFAASCSVAVPGTTTTEAPHA